MTLINAVTRISLSIRFLHRAGLEQSESALLIVLQFVKFIYRKFRFADAVASCLEKNMSLSRSCIFEPLGKTLLFLETHFLLYFCVWHSFYNRHHFVRVQQTPYSNFCFSNVGRLIKLILT